jgi:hypothetical protein
VLSDVLPGGTTVVWAKGTARPAWFALQAQQQMEDARPSSSDGANCTGDNAELDPCSAQARGAANPPATAQSVPGMTGKQRKVCAKATRRMLKSRGGTCELHAVLDSVGEACKAAGEAPALQKALKKSWKHHLRNSSLWDVRSGSVTMSQSAVQ